MRKVLLFCSLLTMFVCGEVAAQRSNTSNTRAGVGRGKVSIRSGVGNLLGTRVTTTTTASQATAGDGLTCANRVFDAIAAAKICGNTATTGTALKDEGFVGCYKDIMTGSARDFFEGSPYGSGKAFFAISTLSTCNCGTNADGTAINCQDVVFSYMKSLARPGDITDALTCKTSFESCANLICGNDYAKCADILEGGLQDTTQLTDAAIMDKIAALIAQLGTTNGSLDLTKVGTELENRILVCKTDILDKCKLGVDSEGVAAVDTSKNTQIFTEYRNSFVRSAASALSAKYSASAKQGALDVLACAEKVDTCMKKHCGNDYAKCLTTSDFTADVTVLNGYKAMCYADLLNCAKINVQAQTDGYTFLASEDDEVEVEWKQFIKRVDAYGLSKGAGRRQLEEKLKVLLTAAQKSCQDNGGQANYVREKAAAYAANTTGNTVYYNKMQCAFPLTINTGATAEAPEGVKMGESVVCDASYFNINEDVKKNAKAWGMVLGGVIGAGAGVGAANIGKQDWVGKNQYNEDGEATNVGNKAGEATNVGNKAGEMAVLGAGGGALGVGLGAAIGNAIQKKAVEKELARHKCILGGKQYSLGDTMTVKKSGAFMDLDDFYDANPELITITAKEGESSSVESTSYVNAVVKIKNDTVREQSSENLFQ